MTQTASIIQPIQDAVALDGLAAHVSGTAARVAGSPVGGLLQGAGGIPLHPALVHFPIGFATGALAVDLLGGAESDRATRILTRLAFASALPAAVTGMASLDRAPADDGVRRLGGVHAVTNVTGTLLAVTSCLSRVAGHTGLARALLLGSVAAYGAGGFLGGHLGHGGDAD